MYLSTYRIRTICGAYRPALAVVLLSALLGTAGCSHEPAVKPLPPGPAAVTPPMQLRAARVNAMRAAAEARGKRMQQMEKH